MTHEIFEHTADIGIRVRAATLEELFADAARGLFSIIVANPETVRPLQEITFSISGSQHEDLLIDWLDELLYTFDTNRLLFREFYVRQNQEGLSASARGEPIDRARHELHMEVKAITYHGLKVDRDGDGWLAEVIVDI
jgi:SHS2 domain-containing protein